MDRTSPTRLLEKALKSAISEPELVADIIEACRLTGVSAANLAEWSTTECAERLFLTEEEAVKLVAECRRALQTGQAAPFDPETEQSPDSNGAHFEKEGPFVASGNLSIATEAAATSPAAGLTEPTEPATPELANRESVNVMQANSYEFFNHAPIDHITEEVIPAGETLQLGGSIVQPRNRRTQDSVGTRYEISWENDNSYADEQDEVKSERTVAYGAGEVEEEEEGEEVYKHQDLAHQQRFVVEEEDEEGWEEKWAAGNLAIVNAAQVNAAVQQAQPEPAADLLACEHSEKEPTIEEHGPADDDEAEHVSAEETTPAVTIKPSTSKRISELINLFEEEAQQKQERKLAEEAKDDGDVGAVDVHDAEQHDEHDADAEQTHDEEPQQQQEWKLIEEAEDNDDAEDNDAEDVTAEQHDEGVDGVEERHEEVERQSTPALVRSSTPPRRTQSSSGIPSREPSYMRATKSSSARASDEADAPALKLSTNNSNSNKKSKPKNSPYANVVSRLLAPTVSHMVRVSATASEGKAAREQAEMRESVRRSARMSQVLAAPQGQRVTKLQPFSITGVMRPKSAASGPTTEELRYMEAQRQVFKPQPAPSSTRNPLPLDGFARAQTKPKDPQTVFQPFNLASSQKSEKYKAMRAARLEAEAKAAAAAAQFKARPANLGILSEPARLPAKQTVHPPTTPVAPALKTVVRAEHHNKVLTPAKRLRMSAEERKAIEERERKAAELEAELAAAAEKEAAEAAEQAMLMSLDIAAYRKTLAFKASPKPDQSVPFKVDLSKANPVTKPVQPNLRITARLGEKVSQKDRTDTYCPFADAKSCFTRTGSAGIYVRASTSVLSTRRRPGSAHIVGQSASIGANVDAKGQVNIMPELKEALEVALGSVASEATSGDVTADHPSPRMVANAAPVLAA